MKILNTLIIVIILSSLTGFSQTQVVLLENAKGIVPDNLGSVTLWENQIDGYPDATQSDTNLGAEQSHETYPGKTTVRFNKDGSFLKIEGSGGYVSDKAYSIFYVGSVLDQNSGDKEASLVSNYSIPTWSTVTGIRLIRTSDGRVCLDYSKTGNYRRLTLGTVPIDGFFFFGFKIDANGNYKYFDNTSPIITVGKINDTMIPSNEDLRFNLFAIKGDAKTYSHTEMVEFSLYDGTLNDVDFQNEYNRLATDYNDLVVPEFSVREVSPEDKTGLPADSPIVITFDQSIDENSDYPKIYVNKSDTEASGNWVLSPSNILTFTPTENWPANGLVSVQIQEGLKSTNDLSIALAKGDTYNFIVEAEKTFEYVSYQLDEPIATVDFPIVGHKLPLRLTTPVINENTTKKFPVHIWVHGGGWAGGSPEASDASYSPQGEYLAENLGVASLGVSYRCSGSSGTFSLALDDVDTAYQWALENAEQYNFDMTRVFFSGGSAGTPLAALIAQRYEGVLGYIGFNGIYDFVNDAGDFGVGNWYKQNVPSETANSPIFQLSNTPPAAIMMHGDADTTISHTQSTLFADAIKAKGGDAEAVIYPGEVHAFFNPGKPAYEDVLIEMVNFINRKLSEQSLSVIDINSSDKIKAYPNPVKKGDNLQLKSNFNSEKVDVQIMNQLGQIILSKRVYTIEDNIISIETKAFKSGIYILKISVNQTSNSLKFIIK
ncbi:alpha/beta hydrolase fold domain-containing protein [Flavivirga jejuensis]|uniref:Alpha/beta hydrolase fold domain-containing protein n=1 Tax=Flavivirga jejuensis TaxID=870487 RepID=A0ABT8WK71_9FLAO|nr:alpha/beta hydrolase fold domain-containing protein [Flavivirga jejuensis]MDO5973465.1 alpha/beta hydrolase fold domain-containing protein [Flavivirga jejuensis]